MRRALFKGVATRDSLDRAWNSRNEHIYYCNTGQGSQFTSAAFVVLVQQHGIQLSMDGTGAWRDNLFVERLWKSATYEEVYLHVSDSVPDAQRGLARHFTFCHQGRPHGALDGRTPDMVYFGVPLHRKAA